MLDSYFFLKKKGIQIMWKKFNFDISEQITIGIEFIYYNLKPLIFIYENQKKKFSSRQELQNKKKTQQNRKMRLRTEDS